MRLLMLATCVDTTPQTVSMFTFVVRTLAENAELHIINYSNAWSKHGLLQYSIIVGEVHFTGNSSKCDANNIILHPLTSYIEQT